uniref:F-box domain-containing protein n=1 Tax=Aegilops tauschii TaxID=37682 RepID=M8C8V7_AEGTA
MELRSGRRLWRSPPHGPRPQNTDLISSLPDEMLLLILTRLRCVRTAVQTGLRSRRWRGLWTGLADLTSRNLKPARIEAILATDFAASTTAASTLDICLETRYTADLASSLLRAAARVSPRELVFTSSANWSDWGDIKLHCFNCTTSIELQSRVFRVDVAPPFAGEFTSLERLSLAGYIINLGVLLSRCPRLRVLSLNSRGKYDMSITLPPNSVFPTLDSLSLTGQIDGLGNLLNLCQCLRVLSVTYTNSQELTRPPAAEFRALEKLSLFGNIANPGTLLNRCPCLRLLSVTFYGMALASLKTALATIGEATIGEAAPVGLTLSRLSISIPWRDSIDAACFASLLHMAVSQSPQELIIIDNFDGCDLNMRCQRRINADLPCFQHATSIEMNLQIVCFTSLSTTEEFLALERLTLLGCCSTIDVGTLVTRCPRLRVLEINLARVNITVHSALLQKLKVYMNNHMECHDIDIVTPMLKQLQMVIVGADMDTRVSISAPVVEKVKWQRWYTEFHHAFGSWRLRNMSMEVIENNGIDNGEHVLRLHLYALVRLLSYVLLKLPSDLRF